MTDQNMFWLENAQMNFLEAKWRGDYETCQLIIEDMGDVSEECARTHRKMLLETPISQFAITSPYIKII